MYDDNPYEDSYQPPTTSAPLKPGDPGYRMATWANSYNPGADWNNGVYAPPSGRYDYNNGSAPNSPNEPLQAGNVWQWEGPQTASWNMTTNQWDRGVWQQRAAAPTKTTDTAPPPSTGGPAPTGSVPSVPASGAPSSSMPANLSGLFTEPIAKTPIQSAYQDALLKYMAKSQETPSLSDSTLAPQVEVFRAGAQRGQERQRLAAAERAAANGQSESGYLDNLINKGVQDQNFNTASYNANLLGSEMGKRRQELQAALQLASATGDAEAARELQRRMALLQGELGFGDLDLRRFLGTENLNQNALQMILGGL